MEINYNLTPCDLRKIKRFKNPTIKLNKDKINKNSKYTLYLTVKQFNDLISKGFINYKFTDYRKKKALMVGGNLLTSILNIGKTLLPSLIPIAKKAAVPLAIGLTSTALNETLKKKMTSKKSKKQTGGLLNITIDKKTKKAIEQLHNLLLNKKTIVDSQSGGAILSTLLPLAISFIPDIIKSISGKGYKQDFHY